MRILDPKKAQNLAISLRALSVSPEEVCSAVKEGKTNSHITDLLRAYVLPFFLKKKSIGLIYAQ